MADFDYESLLDRARDNIPQELSSSERWKLPEPDVMIEGSQTIIRNFGDIIDMMDRDGNHVYHFLQNELGTSGSREDRRVLLTWIEKLGNYVKTFILCGQCNAPDTRFIKEDRTTLLKCQACGATRPVRL